MQTKIKHQLKSYFIFTANERRAVLLLITFIFIFFILPYIFPTVLKPKQESVKEGVRISFTQGQSSEKSSFKEEVNFSDKPESNSYARLFYFDPNTASLEDWMAMGLKEKTAQTIMRYRSKGGKFRSAEDIKKIWGLSSQMAEALIPFVRIKSDPRENVNRVSKEFLARDGNKAYLKIDINSAPLEEWEKLKGIGPATAARIVKFREKLGGFFSVEQIGETYGLQDSVFRQIRSQLIIHNDSIQKININYATIEELGRHPYIRFKTAKAIIAYRDQNGFYKLVSDLQKIESISAEVYQKMEKYLTADN